MCGVSWAVLAARTDGVRGSAGQRVPVTARVDVPGWGLWLDPPFSIEAWPRRCAPHHFPDVGSELCWEWALVVDEGR